MYFFLFQIGGLLQTCRGTYTAYDGDISFLGTVMAQLPIDVRLSKFIILGHLFGCLKEAIIIGKYFFLLALYVSKGSCIIRVYFDYELQRCKEYNGSMEFQRLAIVYNDNNSH